MYHVSVTVERPMSFSTKLSLMLSVLSLIDIELKTAKFKNVEREAGVTLVGSLF